MVYKYSAFWSSLKKEPEKPQGIFLCVSVLTLNLPTTTIVAQPFNVIKWQMKFNPVA